MAKLSDAQLKAKIADFLIDNRTGEVSVAEVRTL